MGFLRVRGLVRAFVMGTTALVLTPSVAFAATFTSEAPFGELNRQPSLVGVTAFGSVAFDVRTPTIKVDGVAYKTQVSSGTTSGYWKATEIYDAAAGVWKTRWTWVPTTSEPNKVTIYSYPVFSAPLSDGLHAVAASIRDTKGAVWTDSWTFNLNVAPTLGAPLPSGGSTVSTAQPVISIPASDNDARPMTASARVNGVDVPASISAGAVVVATPPLTNDATTTVSVTITDAAGNTASKTWSFWVQVFSEMSTSGTGCATCHPGYENDPDMGDGCLTCHGGTLDSPHAATPSALHSRADVSACSPCHVSDITVEHARHTDDGGAPLTCLTCHGSDVAAVRAAIAAGTTRCDACHTGAAHAGADAVHAAAMQSCTGSGCHSGQLPTIHAATGCATCHTASGTKACIACHSDRVNPDGSIINHGFDPVTHTAQFGSQAISGVWGGSARPEGYLPGAIQDGFDPSGDGAKTAAITVYPASPTTLWDKIDDSQAAGDGDATYFMFTGVGRAMLSYGTFAIPSGASISDVTVYYRARRVTTTTTSRVGVSLNVGGTYYDTGSPGVLPPTSYPTGNGTAVVLTSNPKTGTAWSAADLNDKTGPNALREFGIYATNVTPNIRVTQCFLIVNYTMDPTVAYGPIGCASCHDSRLDIEHFKASSSSSTSSCGACHPQPRDTLATWGKTCVQAGCHPSGTSTEMHAGQGTAHVVTSDPDGCTGNCHYPSLTDEHHKLIVTRNLTPYTRGYNTLGVTCEQCHQSAKFTSLAGSWQKKCTDCHTTYHPTLHTVHLTPNLAGGYAAGMGGQRTCPKPYNGESCSNPICHHADSPLAAASDVTVTHAARGCGGPDLMCHNDAAPSDRPGTGFLEDCGICHYSTNTVAGYPDSF